ncbi:MAG: U32 family peptidase [Candidatus Paceibacterota bacterium]|jgi:collagenase-like PrtC family protease
MDSSNKSSITIPCHWNKETINTIIRQNKEIDGPQVVEVYGVLPDGGPIGHGRSRESVPQVSREEACDFRSYLREQGLNFTYLLNAPFRLEDEKQRIKLDEYLKWVINDLRPDAVTISSPELMGIVREISSKIPIHISTIAGVKSVVDLERYLSFKPSRLVPHHDCGKDFITLKELVEMASKHNIEIELLSTESCLRRCPNRETHYKYLAQETKDHPFHTTCNTQKIENPAEFLLAGGIIRPEDMDFYKKLGVRYFKISGRSKPAIWLPKVVEAYQRKSYDGNLIRLLGIDPKLEAENWIYIDNKALNGFIEGYPQTGDYQDELHYCDKWMMKLFRDKKFNLNDGSEYIIENEHLVLKNRGENAENIVNSEFRKGLH